MPQTIIADAKEIIVADVAPPPNELGAASAPAEPIGIVWLILIAAAIFALAFLVLKLLSNFKKS